MGPVLTAVTIMTVLAVTLAVVLAMSWRFLRVYEDPRLGVVEEMLPGNNCGACGEPGCRAFAEKVVNGTVSPGKCTVSPPATLGAIADFLGVDVGSEERRIARLHCGGGIGRVGNLAAYQGVPSCRAAALVSGGPSACSWACLGLGDCEVACTFDAITMNERGLPVVDPARCSACNDCVDVCPQGLFELVPESQRLFVQCKTPLTGDAARLRCFVACDACGRCALDAPAGAVTLVNGLPQIRWDAAVRPGPEATARCPTGAIVWLDGAQFEEPALPGARRRHA